MKNWVKKSKGRSPGVLTYTDENIDPKLYSGIEALKQMYKYYKYYYDKHNLNTNAKG